MAYIGRSPQYGSYEKQALTGDGSTVTFTLDYVLGSASSVLVSVAGVHQEPEVAYNLTSNGTTITFTAAPAAIDTVFIIYLGVALDIATVGSGVITSRTELATQAADDDLLLIYDTSTGGLKKITKANLSPVVSDTTPQLGGDLDLNSNDVIGTGDINITGSITASANLAGTLTTATQTNITSVGSLTSLNVNGTLLPYKAYIAEATLTDGATIDWNMATESVAKVTLADNRTLNAPTNGSTGQFASLLIIQDGTGTRTLTWNAVYEFATDTAPTLTATAGLADLFTFRYNGTKWLEVGRNLALTVA